MTSRWLSRVALRRAAEAVSCSRMALLSNLEKTVEFHFHLVTTALLEVGEVVPATRIGAGRPPIVRTPPDADCGTLQL